RTLLALDALNPRSSIGRALNHVAELSSLGAEETRPISKIGSCCTHMVRKRVRPKRAHRLTVRSGIKRSSESDWKPIIRHVCHGEPVSRRLTLLPMSFAVRDDDSRLVEIRLRWQRKIRGHCSLNGITWESGRIGEPYSIRFPYVQTSHDLHSLARFVYRTIAQSSSSKASAHNKRKR